MRIKPYITEKSLRLAKDGIFTFTTDKLANKIELAKILKKLHNVKIEKVSAANVKPTAKSFKRRAGLTKGFKKMIVRTAKGKKIPGFETMAQIKDKTNDKKA